MASPIRASARPSDQPWLRAAPGDNSPREREDEVEAATTVSIVRTSWTGASGFMLATAAMAFISVSVITNALRLRKLDLR